MTSIVGILNITPDSFSDGGDYLSPEAAAEKSIEMVKDGAAVIDVGAESTRPGAIAISPDEEWKRLYPVIDLLRNCDLNAWISIDTRHPENAVKAIHTGVDWINDVSGFTSKKMIDAVADNAVNIVVMHNMGIPADKNKTIPNDQDPVDYICHWADNKLKELELSGIDRERIIFDPGIGFGKTPEQSYEIIKDVKAFKKLNTRIMIGHSRKSFLSLVTDKEAKNRDTETAAFSSYLAANTVDYLRVHNVKANMKAINNKVTALPRIK